MIATVFLGVACRRNKFLSGGTNSVRACSGGVALFSYFHLQFPCIRPILSTTRQLLHNFRQMQGRTKSSNAGLVIFATKLLLFGRFSDGCVKIAPPFLFRGDPHNPRTITFAHQGKDLRPTVGETNHLHGLRYA